MRTKVEIGKVNMAVEELLNTSRSVRDLRQELEGVRRWLCQLSQLDTCLVELSRQEEALVLMTARLVNMSTALQQVSDSYSMTEIKNLDILEEVEHSSPDSAAVVMYGPGSVLQQRIEQVLYKK